MSMPGEQRRTGTILVAEDDASIRTLLESSLRAAGYAVRSTPRGGAVLTAAHDDAPDLVVLDVMLPDLDGFEVARGLRGGGHDIPILFLTARTDPHDRIRGLSVGGDDYVTKPFHVTEVILRIQAILRRARGAVDDHRLRFADLVLDDAAHEVYRAGIYIPLSPTEFRLLACLLAEPNHVLTKSTILHRVWQHDFTGDGRVVDTYVKYLRRKIDRFDPPLIHTVRGVGFCLRLPRDSTRATADA